MQGNRVEFGVKLTCKHALPGETAQGIRVDFNAGFACKCAL